MKKRPPVDDYIESAPLLRHVRIMQEVIEFMDETPERREHLGDLQMFYLDLLQRELAPHAATLAPRSPNWKTPIPRWPRRSRWSGQESKPCRTDASRCRQASRSRGA